MSDSPDRQIDIEMQRSRMLNILRGADTAIMIGIAEGRIFHVYVNASPLDRRALSEMLLDVAPRFEGSTKD